MQELAWWLVAVLALACAALAGLLWLRRGGGARGEARPGEVTGTAVHEGRGVTEAFPASAGGVGLVPRPASGAPPHHPVAALVAPPVVRPPATLVAARARRYELRDAIAEPVLTLARASRIEWVYAHPARTTPMQAEALAAALTHAPLLATTEADGQGDLYRVALRAGAALPLARGQLALSDLRVVPAQSLDVLRSPALAAMVMAMHCTPAYLYALRREVVAMQADAASWPRETSGVDERLRALLQELSRHLREVEESHAGAIRQPIFIARVAEFCAQTQREWRLAGESAASARLLAAWHGLRLALGDASPASVVILRAAQQALREGPSTAGMSGGLPAVGREAARRALAATIRAIEAGFAGSASLSLLLRLDSLGRVLEVRVPPSE